MTFINFVILPLILDRQAPPLSLPVVFLCNRKLRCEDAQTAEMELIAAQYRGRASVLQAKLFVLLL